MAARRRRARQGLTNWQNRGQIKWVLGRACPACHGEHAWALGSSRSGSGRGCGGAGGYTRRSAACWVHGMAYGPWNLAQTNEGGSGVLTVGRYRRKGRCSVVIGEFRAVALGGACGPGGGVLHRSPDPHWSMWGGAAKQYKGSGKREQHRWRSNSTVEELTVLSP